MDDEEFEDYLVDKAKKILNEEIIETSEEERKPPEMPKKRNKWDEKADKESKIPFSWDPRELEHLTENRKRMSNEQLKKFFKKDSEFHEELEELGEWKGFSRWEERLMVQQHNVKSPEELAEELDRNVKEVELKMHMMGLIQNHG